MTSGAFPRPGLAWFTVGLLTAAYVLSLSQAEARPVAQADVPAH